MTFAEFITLWTEKYNDYDKNNSFQCVDIVEQYVKDVLLQKWIPGNAIDLWSNADPLIYDKIGNTPINFPLSGDIVIWKFPLPNNDGHTAIAMISDANHLNTFDQNWSIDKKCHIVNHTYDNVLGWLHPKIFATQNQPPYINHNVDEFITKVKQVAHNVIIEMDSLL